MAPPLVPSVVEQSLINSIQAGVPADFYAAATDAARTVRGAALVQALLGVNIATVPASTTLEIRSAVITGEIDLESETLQHHLEFRDCRISDRPINLRGAHVRGIRIEGGQIAGIRADGATFDGSIYLGNGLVSMSEINLTDAEVSGALEVDRAHLGRSNSTCLNAPRVTVHGLVEFRNQSTCLGEVRFADAKIEGGLTCEWVQMHNDAGTALNLARAKIDVGVKLWRRFESKGEVNLSLAHIEGHLESEDAIFMNGDRTALRATSTSINGGVFLRAGFEASGMVNFSYAKVAANIECSGAAFRNRLDQCFSLTLGHCTSLLMRGPLQFDGEVNLMGAKLDGLFECRAVKFRNEFRTAIRADGLTTRSAFLLLNGCEVEGAIRVPFSNIGATFECHGVKLSNRSGLAIDGSEMKTADSVQFKKGFHSIGEVRLNGAEINGNLEFENAKFENRQQTAFRAENARIKGALLFSSESNAFGAFVISQCAATNVNFRQGLLSNPTGNVLIAPELKITGNVEFHTGFIAKGTVVLAGANVGGSLTFEGAEINATGRAALLAQNANVGLHFIVENDSVFRGEVSFIDANVGGGFDCRECRFLNRGGQALSAFRFSVKNNLHLRRGFVAEGQIQLSGARVGYLDFGSGSFSNPGRIAVTCTDLQCGGNASFGSAHLQGGLDIRRAKIGGDVNCDGLDVEDEATETVLATGLKAGGSLILKNLPRPPNGAVDFSGASFLAIDDDRSGWPKSDQLILSNLTYQSFSKDSPVDRRPWLRLQKDYTAQPYEQAARVLANMGRDREARWIFIAKEDDLLEKGDLSWSARFGKRFLGWTIGYGYQVWRALLWALAIILMGWAIFSWARKENVMQPSIPPSASSTSSPPAQREFVPLAYSLDIFLPVVDLSQKKTWSPVPSPHAKWQWIFPIWSWVEILSGWLLTTVSVAGLTGLVKKG